MTDIVDEQEREWIEFERSQLAQRICPGSGARLMRRSGFDGPLDPAGDTYSCEVCDCFGYDPNRVGAGSLTSQTPSP